MSTLKLMLCLNSISLFMILVLAGSKKVKCQTEEECQMKPQHYRVYSNVKQALEQDFSIAGKDIVPWIRSVEVLKRRFGKDVKGEQFSSSRINGSELVLSLLDNPKLRNAMEVFETDEGRQLVNLYKTSINGNKQNLACSKWRIDEIEFAAKKLDKEERLAQVFANIHKNFVKRSARRCLKTSCGSIEDNMNRLDSILRRSIRRKGFLVHSLPFEATTEMVVPISSSSSSSVNGSTMEEPTSNPLEEAVIAALVNEPTNEFQSEELELCRFLKRTNATKCQLSGSELSEITFATPSNTNSSATSDKPSLKDYLADYQANINKTTGQEEGVPSPSASDKVLAQCSVIEPVLDYHLYGLRWYQRQSLITAEKLRKKVFWCPSLAYWFELGRLCGELKISLDGNNRNASTNNETFAY